MRHLEIVSDIKVRPKQRPRFFRGIAITASATREFEATVKTLFRGLCSEPFEGPLSVTFVAYFAKPKKSAFSYPPRGDLDNLFKSVADAGNDVLWKDDSQIVALKAAKRWATEDGFSITIREDLDE
jgi:Holliday junction resolvase RusA-like endonuclease